MLRWDQTEYILKGIYLGLFAMIALQQPTWPQIGIVVAWMFGTLVVCLGVAAFRKIREGFRVRNRVAGFILFLLLENPGLVYLGVIGGLTLGAYTVYKEHDTGEWRLVLAPVLGGAVLGILFWYLRQAKLGRWRVWLSLAVGVAMVGGSIAFLNSLPEDSGRLQFYDEIGWLFIIALPGFYLLTFAGFVEETEVEIAAMSAALGIGMYLIVLTTNTPPHYGMYVLVFPAVIYFVYTRRILPGLRVFKHVLRGISYGQMSNFRLALLSLSRAVELDRSSTFAREQLWNVHQKMDYDHLENDPETLAVVNFELCLERAGWLLLQDKPTPEKITESHRLINLVESHRPAAAPRCAYWRTVALLHEKKVDEAAESLTSVLQLPEQDSPHRRSILFAAWQLALVQHPKMRELAGEPMLEQPGVRLDAIAAVERVLAVQPENADAWNLKRSLYSELQEEHYNQAFGDDGTADLFDHEYVLQLGQALLEDAAQLDRGVEYMRIAARGLPAKAPVVHLQIAKTYETAGDTDAMWEYYRSMKAAGRKTGPANMDAEDRQAMFNAAKWCAETALENENFDEAMDSFHFYTMNDRAGFETYRALADLYERKGDSWTALHCTEHALSYGVSEKDRKDLLERKDRYYYSITPDELKERLEKVYKWFDVDYCMSKVKWILENQQNGDLDLLDWASHLAELAQIAKPDSLTTKVLRGRLARLRGETEQALSLFEEVRQGKPEKFATGEDEESWYIANRLLGELYIDEKPDQAVECLQEFRNSSKSGARTLFNLGRAHENLGDHKRAIQLFEQATAYEGNPITWEAQEALDRLRQSGYAGN